MKNIIVTMKMIKYCYDIETFSPDEKDVTEERWDYKEKKLVKKYSPNPLKEKIISIALLHTEIDTEPFVFSGDNEKEILEHFWKTVYYADELIGFNSDYFDWNYIIVRSLVNNVKIDKTKKQTDLRKLAFGSNFFKGTLGDFAKEILGLELSTENGSKMRENYIKGDWDTIKNHNKEDVIITKSLFIKFRELGLL